MQGKLGNSWERLGTEQIASNYMLSNAPSAMVLPFDRFACFESHVPAGDRPFLHFVGTYRYGNGVYRRRAREFLGQYRKP